MAGPISPDDVDEKKKELIPDFVFDAFNECIAQNYKNGSASVKQKDVVEAILKQMAPSQRDTEKIYKEHWLDVESAYTRAGWRVTYDKPAWNESYDALFVFKRKSPSYVKPPEGEWVFIT